MIALNKKFDDVYSGLSMTFENGYSISIQFGMGNYCENRDKSKDSSKNVEIAIFDKDSNFHRLENMYDDVKGYVEMDELADII